jgi:flagellar FliL protein
LLLSMSLLLGAGGFGSSYFGLWSPQQTIGDLLDPTTEVVAPATVFVAIPQIEVAVSGTGGRRHLLVSAVIETDRDSEGKLSEMIPRLLDRMTGFLSAIDHRAYDKRGVLEIIKLELGARIATDLGDIPVHDLLITEFRFR